MSNREIVNDLEIRLVGMSRSGNHALVNWILAQTSGRACFLNCAEPGSNPFRSARPLDDGAVCHASYPEFDLEREREGHFTFKKLLLYSHEDCFLGYVRKTDDEFLHDQWHGPSRRRVDVLLLRDPFNLFASRIKTTNQQESQRTALRIWKQHAREYLGQRTLLRDDRLLVSYNRWVADAAYRRSIAEALGLDFSDAGRQDVPRVAAGSSFDGRAFHGRAADMNVTERWRWLEHSPLLPELFDRQTLELADRIFGPVCSEAFYARSHALHGPRSARPEAAATIPATDQ